MRAQAARSPGNAGHLAAQLERLVRDRSFAATIGAAGRAWLIENDWTWQGNARRVVDAWRSLGAEVAV
jgi:hypothetical protein